MKKLLICLKVMLFISVVTTFAQSKIKINDTWRFTLEDNPSFSQEIFDDSSWRTLDVPHDWAFEGGYAEDNISGSKCGYAASGIGWYRKTLELSKEQCSDDKRLIIAFDAVYMNSEVWINGYYLGKRPYGYISFEYEISKYIKPGKNSIAVKVDNTLGFSARWYHGCGIYGNVYLKESGVSRFATDGIFVRTPSVDKNKAEVLIDWEIERVGKNRELTAQFELYDKSGEIVSKSEKIDIEKSSGELTLYIENPLIWDVFTPNLYELKATVYKGDKIEDINHITFGVRTLKWDIKSGFWINGRNTKIRGMCEHLEGGPVGAAWSENLMRWKIEKLKAMGCNAIRTAHNPQLPIFYEICNELGMLVFDEAFDGWARKADFDYGMQAFDQWALVDLRDFIRRDRNHPSIFLWSVGNETDGDIAPTLVDICHKNDNTRLVTSSMSNLSDMDIFGGNGASEEKWFMESFETTDKPFLGTEYPHGGSTRGYYRSTTFYTRGYPSVRVDPFETPNLTENEVFQYEWNDISKEGVAKKTLTSGFDNEIVRINDRQTLAYLRDKPWFSGMFKWVGFNYYGEATKGMWPFRGSDSGVADWAGFEKDTYYLYQSQWCDKPMIHIMPHWTHPYMKIGTEIPVFVYTTGDEVELFLNGKSLGVKRRGLAWNQMQCDWLVAYTPGVLEAVSYKDGREIARAKQITSLEPSALKLTGEESFLVGDKTDLHIITIDQLDSNNILYPYGENRVFYNVDGDAEIFSAENGSNYDVDINYNATSRCSYFGKQRLFIRKTGSREATIFVGSILGDKRLKISKNISIDVEATNLKGDNIDAKCNIYYTIDGSIPTINSKKYTKPFEVELETVVKAVAIRDGKELFVMEEKFGANEGLYWGEAKSKEPSLDIIQAEVCNLTNCNIIDNKKDKQNNNINKAIETIEGSRELFYPGRVVVEPTSSSSFCSYYLENDGSEVVLPLNVYLLAKEAANPSFKLYNNEILVSEATINIPTERVARWMQCKLEIPIKIGGNQIKLEIIDGQNIAIDWLELAH